jgi:hypothetical protein
MATDKRGNLLLNIGRFSQACQAIHQAMKHDVPMTEAEQLKLENNLVLIQMGYLEWKRRNRSAKADLLRQETRAAA